MGDTPHKKVKLDEYSTYAHSGHHSRKTSLIQRLDRIRPKGESYTTIPFEVSQFEIPLEYKTSRDEPEPMEEEAQ